MFRHSHAYSGFSTNDLAAARAFYAGVLGLDVTEGEGILHLHLGDGRRIVIQVRDDHEPAKHAVLYFPVADIDMAADRLLEAGVPFEHLDGLPQDEWGIVRPASPHDGPPIAWFKDPGGNILAVLEPTR